MQFFKKDRTINRVNTTSCLKMPEHKTAHYDLDKRVQQMDELAVIAVWQQLLSMGFSMEVPVSYNVDNLCSQLAVLDKYKLLFEELLNVLSRSGLLEQNAEMISVTQKGKDLALEKDWKQRLLSMAAASEDYKAHIDLLLCCLNELPDILTGKQVATDVMFPDGSPHLVEPIYKGNAQADFFNTLLADELIAVIAVAENKLRAGEKIRILEVGGGTGGSTKVLLERLSSYKEQIEYVFSDVSNSFLIHAEKQFSGFGKTFSTRRYNIEQTAEPQGFQSGSFDVIIGTNVLHATRNIATTLREIKVLLKRRGLLMINELATNELFTTLTFGLLDGWWLFEDPSVRMKGSPGLAPMAWQTVMEEAGFYAIRHVPELGITQPQQIVVGASDGWIVCAGAQHKKAVEAPRAVTESRVLSANNLTADVAKQLIAIASSTVKLPEEEFDLEEQFSEYGFDSILGTTFMKNINDHFKITLKVTDIYNYPNIGKLSAYIADNFGDVLSSRIIEPPVQHELNVETARPELVSRFLNPDLKRKEVQENTAESADVAVIGMSGQFGAANNLNEFWEALWNGKSLIEEVPVTKWDPTNHYNEDPSVPNKTYSKWGAFIKDVDKFDPLFFKISGSEAETMDPQQRLFLQHCWNALEDAAIRPADLKEARCGVFAGVGAGDYITNIDDKAATAFWGNSSSILASRISYFLDLKGPAIAIDTACSSSLVALNLACASLLNKETDLVLAGGVSIMHTPNFYKLASRAGMLSKDGKCYAFDSRANGFVPGEGVGVVVLKRLKDALRDGDPVYGIIKGSLTNQDGTTNGIVAPSSVSQTKLEKAVYEKFAIHPETISYIEAHGTGTSLGDPIEFDALQTAFRSFTQRKNFCSIGSVKTNIGHTLMAAGVAGLIKVMLAMKHRKLPPSICFETLNPLINVSESPFRIQNTASEWQTPAESVRRAAISSFGFSGTNAHMVVEEFRPVLQSQTVFSECLIVLSAKDADRLKERVEHLDTYLKQYPDQHLNNLAYTLQVGREAMEQRLGFVCSTLQELKDKLNAFLSGKAHGVVQGNARDGVKQLEIVKELIGEELVARYRSKKEYRKILELWCNGIDLDWKLFYETGLPQRVHLPGYPFAKERYWVEEAHFEDRSGNVNSLLALHPLVHENSSSVSGLMCRSNFTGKESFLDHHKVKADSILPGVAYLEMAREAATRLLNAKTIAFTDINWLTPVWVKDKAVELETELFKTNEGIQFKITSKVGETKLLHARGKIKVDAELQSVTHNISDLKQRLNGTLSHAEFYDRFSSKGLHLGSTFRGVKELFYSDKEALSKIELPVLNGCLLTPGIMDSALQTGLGLHLSASGDEGLSVPYAVKQVNIYKSLPGEVWSYIRYSHQNDRDASIACYDVDIISNEGEVLVTFKDFVVLPLDKKKQDTRRMGSEPVLNCFEPVWKEQQADISTAEAFPDQLIVLMNASPQLAEHIKEQQEAEVVAVMETNETDVFLSVFRELRSKLKQQGKKRLTIVYRNEELAEYYFLSGLLKSASLEDRQLSVQLLGVDDLSPTAAARLCQLLDQESGTRDVEVCYRGSQRYVKDYEKRQSLLDQKSDTFVWKESDVCVITGGAGGIGLLLANYLSGTKKVNVVLLGRRDKDEKLAKWIGDSGKIEYRSCDVTDLNQLQVVTQEIKARYGRINIIIHSAGVTHDALIINKTEPDIREVLEVKIKGTRNLLKLMPQIEPQALVLFSSVAGVYGNAGQCDYSAANAFMDGIAGVSEKHTRIMSINWPLWENGGMKLKPHEKEILRKRWGIVPMPDHVALMAFDGLLGSNQAGQVLLSYGVSLSDQSPVKEDVEKFKEQKATQTTLSGNVENLTERVAEQITEFVAGLLKINKTAIRTDRELGDYGFDSILLTQFTDKMNAFYGLQLTPTVFFNYPTIRELTNYLTDEHHARLSEIYGNHQAVATNNGAEKIAEMAIWQDEEEVQSDHTFFSSASSAPVESAVAVVGMSARFPGSPDVETFWENLVANKDLITEIPEDRWDWREYYGDPVREKNKTRAKWGGFIQDIDKFDPLFFNISPREAVLMDPQQRITLEAVYHALTDAGITRSKIKGSDTGVFIGISTSDYSLLYNNNPDLEKEALYSTGSAHSILANRISYLFDLHGPSEPIDTACSSSLVAIHRAVENIRSGNCQMAIAGGVNAILSPEVTFSFSQAGMLSEDGRCKTFDKSANGYVRGEGVGIIVLKRMDAAISDGDHIYAVIKGSAENHGGKANTLTSPNPKAQMDLLVKAYEKAGIHPSEVGYIEAHGTGTSLGDPIEIDGLKRAFKELYKRHQTDFTGNAYCGVGSVKANIGHLEAAAGIAGVIKTILCINNKTLPGNPHLKNVNDYLNVEGSPFYLLREAQEWPANTKGTRIAGVSSFGFGGANAHIIVGEYISPKKLNPHSKEGPFILPVSARTRKQLDAYVTALVEHCKTRVNPDLSALAYTLQTAREAMRERIVFICNTGEAFISHCNAFLAGETAPFFYTVLDEAGLNGAGDVSQLNPVNYSITELAKQWSNGAYINWNKLYPDGVPGKVKLPFYPFARDRYWIPVKKANPEAKPKPFLHPMLHSVAEGTDGSVYTSLFSGDEHFLRDHAIMGQKVLPGVAYIELVREAAARSGSLPVGAIREITWLAPVKVSDAPVEVTTKLFNEGKRLKFEVWSSVRQQSVKNAQGYIDFGLAEGAGRKDVLAIRNRLQKGKDRNDFYAVFSKLGLELGSSFRGVQAYHYSDEEALAQLNIATHGAYFLSPGIMDSALQTCAGLNFDNPERQLALPFSVRNIILYGQTQMAKWAYATPSATNSPEAAVKNYDIDILDQEGLVLVSFREIAAVPVALPSDTRSVGNEESPELVILNREWKEARLVTDEESHVSRKILFIDKDLSGIKNFNPEDWECHILDDSEENETQRFKRLVEITKHYLTDTQLTKIMIVFPQEKRLRYNYLSGFAKSLQQETAHVRIQLLAIDQPSADPKKWTDIIQQEWRTTEASVKYTDSGRMVEHYESLTLPEQKEGAAIRANGVYVITGGSGKLARIVARYISRTPGTKIILAGRRPLTDDEQKDIAAIEGTEYHAFDTSSLNATKQFIASVIAKHGNLNGIFHTAGVVKDNLLVNKSFTEVQEVFRAKVELIRHLDESTRSVELDFMVLFSSIAALNGNAGQADYASANTHLIDFAEWRNQLQKQQQRYGKTIALAWPYWQAGGMQLNADMIKLLEQQWGIKPLPENEALLVLDRSLSGQSEHLFVLYGNRHTLLDKLTNRKPLQQTEKPFIENADRLITSVADTILDLLSSILMIDRYLIEKDHKLGDYGFDSILLTRFSNELNDYYGISLLPTVFFNHPTVNSLASYLIREEAEKVAQKHLPERTLKVGVAADETVIKPMEHQHFGSNGLKPDKDEEAVAIVGVNTRFPKSPDTETFWNHILNNEHLVSEVPADRWDWKAYYGDPLKEKNKTLAKWGGFIEDMDKFDAAFFGMSPREAQTMDPQQRITLESVYAALQDAGIPFEQLKGTNTGVFIGVSGLDYSVLFNTLPNGDRDAMLSTGSAHSILANRISYLLDLHGPSEPVDTACSSSLIAIHRAAQHIRRGECDMAIAGGVNAILSPDVTLSFSQAGMLSPDGKCKTFDQQANGYVRGEGVGILILKKLSQAVKDNDQIYGIIRGTSENHGGRANTLTSPNPLAQKEVMLKAYREAGTDPRDIGFIEAHGTGTPLGDPIEMEGLKMMFSELYASHNLPVEEQPHCAVGSVKTNIGHLESAAGVAGVIKALCCLNKKVIPGNPHLTQTNEYIKLKNTPLYLAKETQSWDVQAGRKRVAGISSFGFGGTNAHIVLEEFQPVLHQAAVPDRTCVILLSARSKEPLRQMAIDLLAFCTRQPQVVLHNLAFTLMFGRSVMDERLAFKVDSVTDLMSVLKSYLTNAEDALGLYTGNAKKGEARLFMEGEAGRQLINRAMTEGDTATLMEVWAKGVPVDWKQIFKNTQYQKISLPTYPFARVRHWLFEKVSPKELVKQDGKALVPSVSATENFVNSETIAGKLRSILSDVLRIEASTIFDDEPFQDMGLDSVMAGLLIVELNKHFGSVSVKTLLEQDTINKLSKVLAEQFSEIKRLEHVKRPVEYVECLAESDTTEEMLWVIPGMPGILTPYINVGKHFSDIYSVWGITWRAVYDDANPFTTIEECARFNLEQIKRHSPGKRVNLIGHSYGNIIVYEMAKQLTEAGQSVGDVFLIDGAPDFLSKKYSPLQKIELFLQSINTEGQFSQQQIKQLTKQLERVNPKDIPQAIAVMLDKQGIGSEANKRLIKKAYEIYDPAMSLQYKPTSELPLKAVVLRARDSKFYKGKLKDMGWKKYFATIKTDYVDGDHFSVVNGDYTRIVTESTFI